MEPTPMNGTVADYRDLSVAALHQRLFLEREKASPELLTACAEAVIAENECGEWSQEGCEMESVLTRLGVLQNAPAS